MWCVRMQFIIRESHVVSLVIAIALGIGINGRSSGQNQQLAAKSQEEADIVPWEGFLFFDFDFPQNKHQEFLARCAEEHIAIGHTVVVGRRVWYVPKRHWPQAHRLAESMQISTIPPMAGIPVGQSICLVSKSAFEDGKWDAAFDAAMEALRHEDSSNDQSDAIVRDLTPEEQSVPDALHTLKECHLRSVNYAKGLKLPKHEEWARLKQSLTRLEQIAYLGDRISLSRGAVNENGLVVPRCILATAKARTSLPPVQKREHEATSSVEPFEELLKLNIQAAEVSNLYKYFAVNWTFLPDRDGTHNDIPLHAASRYCLCVLINQAFRRRNGIREYDLTDEEWKDVNRISSLVQHKLIDSAGTEK